MPAPWRCGLARDLAWWTPVTPLELRLSFRRLWRHAHHPVLLFFGLLWPWPWHLEIPPQLTPAQLLADPAAVERRQDGIDQLRCIPLFQLRDSALRSVYRLYEYLCCGENFQVQYEVEYFFFHRQQWRLCDIPDPRDDDPQRYAMVASIIDALVESFNWRFRLLAMARDRSTPKEITTREVAPEWTNDVHSLPEPLVFQYGIFEKGAGPFVRRNIHLGAAYFYSV